MNMFEVFGSTFKPNINPTEEELEKTLNSFLYCKWLSNNPTAVQVSLFLDMGSKFIPPQVQYKFAKLALKNSKIGFIQFPKKSKTDKLLEPIIKKYKCNPSVAKEYLKIMGESKARELYDKYNKKVGIQR
jgi:hypothetical protein